MKANISIRSIPISLISGDILIPMIKLLGTTNLIALIISIIILDLASIDPPHSSSLLFVLDPKNWHNKYPCAQCNSIPSKPDLTARTEACEKSWIIFFISSMDADWE